MCMSCMYIVYKSRVSSFRIRRRDKKKSTFSSFAPCWIFKGPSGNESRREKKFSFCLFFLDAEHIYLATPALAPSIYYCLRSVLLVVFPSLPQLFLLIYTYIFIVGSKIDDSQSSFIQGYYNNVAFILQTL